MPLTPQQKGAVDTHVATLSANPSFHEVDEALANLGELGPDVVDYIAGRLRAVFDPKTTPGYLNALSIFRTEAADAVLIEVLETHADWHMAQRAWNMLRERGKLPPRWRTSDNTLTRDLWEEQRAKFTQMPSPPAVVGDDGEYEADIEGYTDAAEADEKPKVKARTRMTQANAGTYLVRTKWLPLLYSNSTAHRAHALDQLTRMGKNAVPGLVASLTEDNRSLWPYSILALKHIGDPAALGALRDLADDDDPLIQTLAGGAARSIERGHVPSKPKPIRTPAPPQPTPWQKRPSAARYNEMKRMEEELDRWERDR